MMKKERLVKLKITLSYLDMEFDRMVYEGEILTVPESRAKEILTAKYGQIIFIPKLVQ